MVDFGVCVYLLSGGCLFDASGIGKDVRISSHIDGGGEGGVQ